MDDNPFSEENSKPVLNETLPEATPPGAESFSVQDQKDKFLSGSSGQTNVQPQQAISSSDAKRGNSNSLREEIRSVRKNIAKLTQKSRQRLAEGKQPWAVFNENLMSYEKSFREVLHYAGAGGLKDFIESRKSQNKGTFVIELMGEGQPLRDLPDIDGGIAVTLADPRDAETKAQDDARNIKVIEGDITSSRTWSELSKMMKAMGTPSADMIICRGVGGVDSMPPEYYSRLVNNAWNRLSSDSGLLVSQIPTKMEDEAGEWNDSLRKTRVNSTFTSGKSTLHQEHSYPAIAIVKDQTSPQKLPLGAVVSPSTIAA